MGKKHQNVSQAELFGISGGSSSGGASKKGGEGLSPAVAPQNKKKPTALSPTDIAFAGTKFPVNDPAFKALRKGHKAHTAVDDDDLDEEVRGSDVLSSPRSKLVSAERSAKLRRDVALGKRRVGNTKVDESSSGDMMSDASSSSEVDGDGDVSSFSEAIDLDDELCADDASNTSDSSAMYGAMNQGDDGNDDEVLDRSSDFEDEEGDSEVDDDADSITSSILAQLEAEGVLDEEEGDEEEIDSDDDAEYADAQQTLKLAPELAAAAKKKNKKGGAAAAPAVGKKRQRGDDEDFIIKGADGERQQMVHFDGFPYTEADLENSLHLLDSFIPDHMLEVDRDAFAALLRSRDSTIIIKQGDDSDDEEKSESDGAESSSTEDEDEGPLSSKPRRLQEDPNVDLSTADDIFGIYSIVDLCTATNANKKEYKDISVAFRRLMDSPWLVLESGVRSVGDLLGAAIPNSRLLVMDCLKTIPPDVSAAALQSLVDAHSHNAAFQVIVLAKAQRSAEAIEADYKTKKTNKKNRVEAPSAAAATTVNLKEYVFWRMCEEVLYEHRDHQTSVTLYKNRSQYDEQPDLERPLSIGFSLSWESFKKAVKECAKRAAETTGYGAM